MSEDEMVGWHHLSNEHELGQTLGDDEGQGGMAISPNVNHSYICCSSVILLSTASKAFRQQ